MLNNISWASYQFATGILVFLYYVLVLILYYRHDLQYYFQKSKFRFYSADKNSNPLLDRARIEIIRELSLEDYQNNVINDLLLSLQFLIKKGAFDNIPKEELLLSLKLKLEHHSGLKDTILQQRINNFIITACTTYCSSHLSGDEVSALWIK